MNKRKLSDVLGKIAVVAIFAGCVEGLDGGLTAWTLICLAVALAAGLLSKKWEGAR